MSPKAIESELIRFTGDYEGHKPTARFIVGTSYCCGVGLTLTGAISVTFLEPDNNPDILQQSWYRHRRQGSSHDKVFCGMIRIKGNEVEERIMEMNKLKGQLDSAMAQTRDEARDIIT